MQYKVTATKQFDEDLVNVYTYFREKFKSESAVNNLRNKVALSIKNLLTIPEAFNKLRMSNNHRSIQCNNYIIVYSVKKNEVILHRFLYAKSDINNRLNSN